MRKVKNWIFRKFFGKETIELCIYRGKDFGIFARNGDRHLRYLCESGSYLFPVDTMIPAMKNLIKKKEKENARNDKSKNSNL